MQLSPFSVTLLVLALPTLPAAVSGQCPVQRVTGETMTGLDGFGSVVVLSGDYALVSDPRDDLGATGVLTGPGAVYAYEKSGGTWTQVQKLAASDGAGLDFFGDAVSSSGSTAAIGAPSHGLVSIGAGAVYVFDRDGSGVWSETTKLSAVDADPFDSFGSSVSSDAGRIAAGAPFDSEAASLAGAAYLFELSGGSWSQAAKLTAPDGAGSDLFGSAVGLSGATCAVGAPSDDDVGLSSGSVSVFEDSGSGYAFTAKLVASDGAGSDFFGSSLAVLPDRIVVGAPNKKVGGSIQAGSVYVFDRNGSSWSETAVLRPADVKASDKFGTSLELSDTGDRLVVGAPGGGATGSGSAYVYDFSGSSWSQTLEVPLDAFTSAPNEFGRTVSFEGDDLLVGSSEFEDVAAWFLSLTGQNCDDLIAIGDSFSIADGGTQYFSLNQGTPAAGDFYLLIGSVSGTRPGTPTGAGILPLNVDGYTLSTIANPNSFPLTNSFATFSSLGSSFAEFSLTPGFDLTLIGVTAHHSYLRISPLGEFLALSKAVPVELLP
ncbi:MAG: FG-GAP repeat protein [Planctomycetota bacterium]